MVSKSCPVPSRMLHHLPPSPRLRPLPIYVISLKRGAVLIHCPPTRPASCPRDVQGCPTWSLQGWPIPCHPQAFSLQHQLGLHRLFLPQPSKHLDLYNFLAQFCHVGSPSLQPPPPQAASQLPRVVMELSHGLDLPPREPIAHRTRSRSVAPPLALFAGCRPYHE